MGQWISSKEFAKSFNANKKSLEKACFRANQKGKKICTFRHNIICFIYAKGIGYAGKILQIWNTPLSQEQVEAIEKGYPVKYVLEEMGNESKAVENPQCAGLWIASASPRNDARLTHNDNKTQPNVMESKDCKTLDCKGIDNEKNFSKHSRKNSTH